MTGHCASEAIFYAGGSRHEEGFSGRRRGHRMHRRLGRHLDGRVHWNRMDLHGRERSGDSWRTRQLGYHHSARHFRRGHASRHARRQSRGLRRRLCVQGVQQPHERDGSGRDREHRQLGVRGLRRAHIRHNRKGCHEHLVQAVLRMPQPRDDSGIGEQSAVQGVRRAPAHQGRQDARVRRQGLERLRVRPVRRDDYRRSRGAADSPPRRFPRA